MIVSQRAWVFVGIAVLAGGCGGVASLTQPDGGTKVIGTGADAATEDAGVDSGATATGECVDGGVTFTFNIEAGTPVCPGSTGSSCQANVDWLTITGPGGAVVPMFNTTCFDCNSCG